GWSSAEVPTAGAGHRLHRVAHSPLDAGTLGLAEATEERHHEVVRFAVGIDTATDLRHPQLDPVMNEERERQGELGPGEGALLLPDHDGVEAPITPSTTRQEPCRFRPSRPRQRPGHPDVEVLRDDLAAVRLDERSRDAALPGDAVLGCLTVLGAHPCV